MTNSVSIFLEGHFKLIAHRKNGGYRILASFCNLILDSGLNRMGSGPCATHCKVGNSSVEPQVSQTALGNQTAQTSDIGSEMIGGDAVGNLYGLVRRVYRFGKGVATGNLSEVGIGWADGLFSRALIKDNDGNPITVTVLADEEFDVVYELRAYAPTTDSTVNTVIAGTPRTFTIRPCGVNNSPTVGSWGYALALLMSEGVTQAGHPRNSIGALGSNASLAGRGDPTPGGTFVVDATAITYAFTDGGYVNNTYRRMLRATWASDRGSVPFGGFMFTTLGGVWQAVVTPVIEKDSSKVYTTDIVISWARKV